MRVTLKAWAKSSLVREDYDFSALADWPKQALKVALLWELDRELGSGRGPFYNEWRIHELKQNKHAKAPVSPTSILHSHSLPQVAACYESQKESVFVKEKEVPLDFKACGRVGGAYTRIHALEIDWRLTETTLVEMFRNWLRHGDHGFRPNVQRDSYPRKGGRNTAGIISYLRDLAVYRISVAGIKRKSGGMGMLDQVGMLKRKSNKGELISSSVWDKAQDRTERKIRGRIGTLCYTAKLEAVGGGKVGFWKNNFIGMDALEADFEV
jgi:hypothetical protein